MASLFNSSQILAMAFVCSVSFIQNTSAQNHQPWQHVDLTSRSEDHIKVDALVDSTEANQGTAIAAPVWIHLRSKRLTGQERIRAVLLNYSYLAYHARPNGAQPGITTLAKTQEFDLQWTGDRFEGKAPETFFVKYRGYGYVNEFFQELAVAIDGEWLVDPMTGSHNFLFQLRAPLN